VKSIAVFSIKGGVGKTTTAVNLAYAAVRGGGRRTLLWDLDPQGAATFTLRLHPRGGSARKAIAGDGGFEALIQATDWPGLDVLPADKSLRQLERQLSADDAPKRIRKALKTFEADYDRVIIDCPPGLTELAEQMFRAVDCMVVPMLPSPLSLRAWEQMQAHLAKHHGDKAPALLPVYTMVDRRKTLHRATLAEAPDQLAIPYASIVEQMAVHQAPVAAMSPSSAAARGYAALWAAVERSLIA
jgi:chromosome partitioning protein